MPSYPTREVNNTGEPLTGPGSVLLTDTDITFTLVDERGIAVAAIDALTNEKIVGASTVTTDGSGLFSITLWPNDRGHIKTRYKVEVDYPGVESFLAALPEGDLTAISWTTFQTYVQPFTAQEINALTTHTTNAGLTHSAFNSTSPGFVPATGNVSPTDVLRADGTFSAITGVRHVIQNNGSNLTERALLNFQGPILSAQDDPGNITTIVTASLGINEGHTIQSNGSPVTQQINLNFSGLASAVDNANASSTDVVVTDPVPNHENATDPHPQYLNTTEADAAYKAIGAVDGHVIQDEGSNVTQRGIMNFTGAAVSVTDETTETRVSVASTSLAPTIVIQGAGDYTVPADIVLADVYLSGGGGGSGGCGATAATEVAFSTGGAGAGVVRRIFSKAELDTMAVGGDVPVTYGAAGAAGSAGAFNGGNGGTSTFGSGANQLTATGGGGGLTAPPAGASQQNGAAGGGGSGPSDCFIYYGANSEPGDGRTGANGLGMSIGGGGNSLFGRGGIGGNVATSPAATTGTGPGAGAGGPINNVSQAAQAGAAGNAGQLYIIEWR